MRNKIFVYIIKGAIIASFFTPLIVSSSFIFPFVFPKTMIFQIIVEIMFVAWLFLAIEDPKYRPQTKKIFWAISLFLAIVFLASIIGVDFAHSFWSNYERMTGIITLLHYFAYFLVLASVLKTKKDWLMVFDFFIGANLLLGFWALLQKFNVEGFVLAGSGRISATFGNAAYYAAYLLFSLFFIAFMYFQRQVKWQKIYYICAFLFTFLILFWTQTRGALLAFGGSLILFLVALLFWKSSPEEKPVIAKFRSLLKKISAVILIGFVLFAALVYFSRNASWVRNSFTLRRLANISAQETTSQTRLLAWRMSWQAVKERPVIGWGWENYNVVFNKFYDPHLYPVENWFDRAHNIVFDTLVTTGFLGFLSFLAIFGAVFVVIWQAYKKKRIDFLNAALFLILPLGYLAQDFFVFDMLFSYMPLFLFLAFINWVDESKPNQNLAQQPAKTNIFLKASLAAALIFSVYFINIKPALAGSWGIQALKDTNLGVDVMQKDFQKSLSYGTFGRFEVRLQILETAKSLMSSYQSGSNKAAVEQFDKFALEEGEKTLTERPSDARYGLIIGQLYLVSAQIDESRLDRAAEILANILKWSPNRQLVLSSLGEAKLRQGKTQEGLNYLQKAIDLNDTVVESHWNLALTYFSLGDLENGQKKLAEMEARFGDDFMTADNYKRLGAILGNQGKAQEALFYLNKGVILAPNDAEFYSLLAGAYAQLGDKAKAIEMAKKVGELNPSLKDAVDEFIKSLEAPKK